MILADGAAEWVYGRQFATWSAIRPIVGDSAVAGWADTVERDCPCAVIDLRLKKLELNISFVV